MISQSVSASFAPSPSDCREFSPFLRQTQTLLKAIPSHIPSAFLIDRQAIADNYALLCKIGGQARCGAAIKADAYGLGAQTVAPVLFDAGCRDFFVAYLQEGLDLQKALPSSPDLNIFVLNGFFPSTASLFSQTGLIPVLTDLSQVRAWREEALRLQKNLPAVLHIDTGMCRSGMPLTQAYELVANPDTLKFFDLRLLMSHLACSSFPDHLYNRQQLQRFNAFLEHASLFLPPVPASLANSGGIFLGKPYHFQLLRPGMALYGLNPLADSSNPLKTVAHVWTRIFQLQRQSQGHSVGYSQTFVAPRDMKIATVSLGYADGIPWTLANKLSFVVYNEENGSAFKAPIVGRISMDLVTLDVTDIPEELVQPGSWVEVMGETHSADDVAEEAQTIGYEILLNLGSRLHRVYTPYSIESAVPQSLAL